MLRLHRTDFAVFNHRGPLLASLPHIKKLEDAVKADASKLQIG